MKNKTNEELQALVAKATAGDKKALETLIAGVQDIIFNMSLRMLGTFADAEDATQDILRLTVPLRRGYFALQQII